MNVQRLYLNILGMVAQRIRNRKNRTHRKMSPVLVVAGVGLEPHDLRVMSPTSYQLLYPAIFNYALQSLFNIAPLPVVVKC